MVTNDALHAALEDRAATYGLLARLFNREVDEALLEGLRALPFPADTGRPDLDEGARLMGAYLAAAHDDARTELAVDFARLFLVRKRSTRVACYPNESVHTSDERITMGDARDEVRALYLREGLKAADATRLGDDHIALELEFMQALAARSLACAPGDEADDGTKWRETLAAQAAFLDGHLLNWVPAFADLMADAAQTDFYRGLAAMLAAFLRDDRAFVEELRN